MNMPTIWQFVYEYDFQWIGVYWYYHLEFGVYIQSFIFLIFRTQDSTMENVMRVQDGIYNSNKVFESQI